MAFQGSDNRFPFCVQCVEGGGHFLEEQNRCGCGGRVWGVCRVYVYVVCSVSKRGLLECLTEWLESLTMSVCMLENVRTEITKLV